MGCGQPWLLELKGSMVSRLGMLLLHRRLAVSSISCSRTTLVLANQSLEIAPEIKGSPIT